MAICFLPSFVLGMLSALFMPMQLVDSSSNLQHQRKCLNSIDFEFSAPLSSLPVISCPPYFFSREVNGGSACNFYACAHDSILITNIYPVNSCQNDTYVQVTDAHGKIVAEQDDSCGNGGLCNYLQITIPGHYQCSRFAVIGACFGGSSCSATNYVYGARSLTLQEAIPSSWPTGTPTTVPSDMPSMVPSTIPTSLPSSMPSTLPSGDPSSHPTSLPSTVPSSRTSTILPTSNPSQSPMTLPSSQPSAEPTMHPTVRPSFQPSATAWPTSKPSRSPISFPINQPSAEPSIDPTSQPSGQPTVQPSTAPNSWPSDAPTSRPSEIPSQSPTKSPSVFPTSFPTSFPSVTPTNVPSLGLSFRPPSAQQPNKVTFAFTIIIVGVGLIAIVLLVFFRWARLNGLDGRRFHSLRGDVLEDTRSVLFTRGGSHDLVTVARGNRGFDRIGSDDEDDLL